MALLPLWTSRWRHIQYICVKTAAAATQGAKGSPLKGTLAAYCVLSATCAAFGLLLDLAPRTTGQWHCPAPFLLRFLFAIFLHMATGMWCKQQQLRVCYARHAVRYTPLAWCFVLLFFANLVLVMSMVYAITNGGSHTKVPSPLERVFFICIRNALHGAVYAGRWCV